MTDFRQVAVLAQLISYVSPVGQNSTTTPLANNATFIGQWEQNSEPDVMVICKTDQTGILYLDFSPDGNNVDSSLAYNVAANSNEIHVLVKAARYFRARLTNNSGSNQTFLRLYTYYGAFDKLTAQVDSTISPDTDAQVVQIPDSPINIARGFVTGRAIWEKFGYNDDVDTGAEETIWPVGGTINFLTGAQTFTVVSSSGDDTAAGTGARTLDLIYVDADWATQTGTVTMNGMSNVVTSFSGYGINRASVTTAGSGTVNAGNITITATLSGTTQAYIPASDGITQQSFFHVPAGSQAIPFFTFLGATSGGAGKVVTLKLYHILANGVRLEKGRYQLDTDVQNGLPILLSAAAPFPGQTRLELRALTSVDNTSVVARLHFYLVGG